MNSRNLYSSKFYRKGRVNMQNVISKLGNYEALLIVRYNAVNIYPLPTIPLSIGGHRGYVSHQKLKRHFRRSTV